MTAEKDPPPLSLAEANATLTAAGQLFEMEERTIRGVPTRTWKNAPASLRAVLDLSLGYGDATYLVYEDERTTYGEHYRIACTLAHRLRDEFGVTQGDRVAIVMRNLPEWVMAFWAITLTGAIVVPLNAWWSGEELRYGLEDSGSKVAFVDTQRAESIRPFLGGLSGFTTLIVTDEHRAVDNPAPTVRVAPDGSAPVTEWPFPLALGPVDEGAVPPDVTIDPDDDATIFYTSGTTGRPKGARGHPSQHVHQPDEPVLPHHEGPAPLRQVPQRPDRNPADGLSALRTPVPRHGLSLGHGGEHRRRQGRSS